MYEMLSKIAQTWGLIAFIIAFALVLIYALAPSRRKEFDHARRIPMEDDELENGDANRG